MSSSPWQSAATEYTGLQGCATKTDFPGALHTVSKGKMQSAERTIFLIKQVACASVEKSRSPGELLFGRLVCANI